MLYPGPALRFIERARSGKVCLGVHHSAMSPQVVEMYGHIGLDYVILGNEVESLDRGKMEDMMRACDASGTAPIIKLLRNDPNLIEEAMNAGAPMVMVPHVTNRKQLDTVLEAARFNPVGTRGLCPLARYNGYGTKDLDEVYEQANKWHGVIPIIEDVEALDNLDEIMSTPDVDIFEVGPFDLSHALGVKRQLTLKNPETMEAMEKIAAAAKRYDKAVLVPLWVTPETDSPEKVVKWQIEQLVSRGITVFYGLEMILVARLFRDLMAVREAK